MKFAASQSLSELKHHIHDIYRKRGSKIRRMVCKNAHLTSRFIATALALFLVLTIVTMVHAAMSAQLESDQIQPKHTVFDNNKFNFGQHTTAGKGILWGYDPVAKTHQQEAVICAGIYSSPAELAVYKGKLYFAADGCDGVLIVYRL